VKNVSNKENELKLKLLIALAAFSSMIALSGCSAQGTKAFFDLKLCGESQSNDISREELQYRLPDADHPTSGNRSCYRIGTGEVYAPVSSPPVVNAARPSYDYNGNRIQPTPVPTPAEATPPVQPVQDIATVFDLAVDQCKDTDTRMASGLAQIDAWRTSEGLGPNPDEHQLVFVSAALNLYKTDPAVATLNPPHRYLSAQMEQAQEAIDNAMQPSEAKQVA
jgi:hypothetical protein